MKKLSLTLACLVTLTGTTLAQGTVRWDTISGSAFTAQTNSTQVGPLYGGFSIGGGSIGNTFNSTISPHAYDVELLYLPGGAQVPAPTTLAALGAWADSGLSAIQTTTASGRFLPANPTTAATVPWAAGVTDSIMLVGWSANLGSTWAQVWTTINSPAGISAIAGRAYLGFSSTGYESPGIADPGINFIGGGPNLGGTPIQSLLTQLYLIDYPPGPEPSSLALVGLGGLTLLLFRRRG